jgi:hypothetical protein
MAFDLLNNVKQKAVSKLPRPQQQPSAPQQDGHVFSNPDGPRLPRTDPKIPDPSYRMPQGPTVPTHQTAYQMPGQPGARGGINPGGMPQGGFDFSRPEGVSAYFQSRGVTPYASSPDYWAQKWQEFGQRDPEYFQRYRSNAEVFTGGPQGTARAMGWGGGQQQQGGGNLGWLLQLLGSRLQQPQQAPQMGQAPQTPQAGTPQVDINSIIQQALRRTF